MTQPSLGTGVVTIRWNRQGKDWMVIIKSGGDIARVYHRVSEASVLRVMRVKLHYGSGYFVLH